MIRLDLYDRHLAFRQSLFGDDFGLGSVTYALGTEGGSLELRFPGPDRPPADVTDVGVLWVQGLPPWVGIVTRLVQVLGESWRATLQPAGWILERRYGFVPTRRITLSELTSLLNVMANDREATCIRDFRLSPLVGEGTVDLGLGQPPEGMSVRHLLDLVAEKYGLVWRIVWDSQAGYAACDLLPNAVLEPRAEIGPQALVDTPEVGVSIEDTVNEVLYAGQVGNVTGVARILARNDDSIALYGLLQGGREVLGQVNDKQAQQALLPLARPAYELALAVVRDAVGGVQPGDTVRVTLPGSRRYWLSVTAMALSASLGSVVLRGIAQEVTG